MHHFANSEQRTATRAVYGGSRRTFRYARAGTVREWPDGRGLLVLGDRTPSNSATHVFFGKSKVDWRRVGMTRRLSVFVPCILCRAFEGLLAKSTAD